MVPLATSRASSDSRRLRELGSPAQHFECVVGADLQPLGQDALGLLDDDPASERQLQLPGDDLAAADGALLQDADGGGIGQGLRQAKFRDAQAAGVIVEQVERAYYLAAQTQRQRVR